jgi:hypothetical protein
MELDFDMAASLHAALGESTEENQLSPMMDETRAWRARQLLRDQKPVSNDAFANSGGTCIMALGGPNLDCEWIIRRISVGGTDVTTSAAGTPYVFRSSAIPVAPFGLRDWIDNAPGVVMPTVAYYSDRQVTLSYPEKLWVVVLGGTAGQQYVATAQATEYDLEVAGPTVQNA